jgi:hypothetical protein
MLKDNSCSQHDICISSDSNMAVCKCWCAECKEIMANTRKAFGGFKADRIAAAAIAAQQLFTSEGNLIKAVK